MKRIDARPVASLPETYNSKKSTASIVEFKATKQQGCVNGNASTYLKLSYSGKLRPSRSGLVFSLALLESKQYTGSIGTNDFGDKSCFASDCQSKEITNKTEISLHLPKVNKGSSPRVKGLVKNG
jgi:hypothetical protein